ncbi:hypothetical protein Tco_1306587, partial [Tanacetum coccineum]
MIDSYKAKVGEEAFENMVEKIKLDVRVSMNEEVDEDLSANAQFMAKNVVSNGMDRDLKKMQGLSALIPANLNELVKVVELQWGGTPMLFLLNCYFRVGYILRFSGLKMINENTNRVNVRTEGMKEFIECVEELEMEDINMCGMFYTWIQRMRNPKLGILKKLDMIM